MSIPYRVQNPATNEVIESFDTATDQEIQDVLSKAYEAFQTWRNTSFAERAKIVNKAADLLRERKTELAKIAAEEMGKQIPELEGEVEFSANILAFYADRAEAYSADMPIEVPGGKAVMRRLPLGVLLGIMPWNYPYYQVARFAGPNLVLGNTIVLKHAPQCPESAEAMQLIFAEAGLPSGAYVNIRVTNDQAAEIIADPRAPSR